MLTGASRLCANSRRKNHQKEKVHQKDRISLLNRQKWSLGGSLLEAVSWRCSLGGGLLETKWSLGVHL